MAAQANLAAVSDRDDSGKVVNQWHIGVKASVDVDVCHPDGVRDWPTDANDMSLPVHNANPVFYPL